MIEHPCPFYIRSCSLLAQAVSLDHVATASQNGLAKRRGSQGTPTNVLRLADVKDGRISGTDARAIPLTDHELEKYQLTEDDLVFTRVNGSRDLVGTALLYREPGSWAFCDHFIRVKTVSETTLPAYLALFFASEKATLHISRHIVTTAGQNTISQPSLLSTPIPIPSVDEQVLIVEEVERRLSVVDKLEATTEANLMQAGALRQSILKRAFSGELVPQDPDDEPASVLLERIREERAATKQKGRRERRSKTGPTKREHAEQGGLF